VNSPPPPSPPSLSLPLSSAIRPIKSSAKANGDENIFNTDRDLRKNNKKQLDEMLAPHYTQEQLKHIPRWDKVALVRSLANLAQDKGVAQDLHRSISLSLSLSTS
jgi:hypothetical protein